MSTPPHPDDVDLVLASASPRRRELLERVGLHLQIMPVDIDETPQDQEPARAYTQRLAQEKSATALTRLADATRAPVLAADTTVVVNGTILGKPADAAEAASMLQRLAGRRHEVITAYAIRLGAQLVQRAVTTEVSFRLIAPDEVDAYVESKEWDGKAGGYAIQGIAAVFVSEVRGSITNVIGLPLAEVIADLRALQALPIYPRAGFGGGAPA